ncbi:EAL domain-containing protein [Planctobacterium marinum]|uniref:EAL domain-containing protein n=1 Tax=Planctobacterium marinum TaxID=1631968 RepID=A0AA48KWI0_9ALTE|nr:hypothetical protein MACH26_41060 [Planctobacterium marinum]
MQFSGTPAINIQGSGSCPANASLQVTFQPILNMETQQVSGAEVLLRVHNDQQLMSTSDYLSSATTSGNIVELDRWVIEESMQVYGQWSEKYHHAIFLSINISETTLTRPDFPGFLQHCLLQYLFYAEFLVLEIDYQSLKNVECQSNIQAIRDLGIQISIDKVDTPEHLTQLYQDKQYSWCKLQSEALNYLRNPVFISEMIKQMENNFVSTIATNIENSDQLELCTQLGLRYFQGYLGSKPLCGEEFESWFLASA